MGERRMRRLVAAVAAAAVTAGLAGLAGASTPAVGASPSAPAAPAAPATPAAPAQAAEPMLMIEPASALVDGSEVTYTAAGLDPDTFVAVVQCQAGSTSLYDGGCDDYDAAYPMVGADGTATGTLRVDAMLSTGFFEEEEEEEAVDCRAAGACVVAVADAEGEGALVATAPLPFVAGSALAPAPTVAVSPAEGLDDLQSVSVTGSGFVWSDRSTRPPSSSRRR